MKELQSRKGGYQMNKSIKKNATLNTIRIFSKLLFPLITIPYVSRVLGVDNVGIYNFAASIVSYFVLIAQLGINTFAIREGAKYRDDRKKMSSFASDVFTINLISTLVSYALLFICIIFATSLKNYSFIIFILSFEILLNTLGCEWIYTIYEEYGYITFRTIVVQILSIIALFLFVKTEYNLINYCYIMVLSISGANIINLFTLRKYCKLKLSISNNTKIYLVPILLLFVNSIATTIYVNSDVTILGLVKSDYYVGLYSIATKIYSTVKSIIAAMIIVSIPRLSYLIGNNKKDEFKELSMKIINSLIAVALPAMVGLIILSDDVILILSGKDFLPGVMSLRILSVALIFSVFCWFYMSCILIPSKKDKDVLIATIISAVVNILLNLILIPFFNQDAAAFTTIIAELISFALCYKKAKEIVKIDIPKKNLLFSSIGCIGIIVYCIILSYIEINIYLGLAIKVIGSVLIYGAIELLLKNDTVIYFKDTLIKTISKFKKNHKVL